MKILIILFIIIIVGLVIYYEWRIRRHKEISSAGGLGGVLKKKREKIEQRKGRILEELKRRGRITNDEVQNLLGVSDATATRYLDELEKEGLIEQIGGAQKDTYYRLK